MSLQFSVRSVNPYKETPAAGSVSAAPEPMAQAPPIIFHPAPLKMSLDNLKNNLIELTKDLLNGTEIPSKIENVFSEHITERKHFKKGEAPADTKKDKDVIKHDHPTHGTKRKHIWLQNLNLKLREHYGYDLTLPTSSEVNIEAKAAHRENIIEYLTKIIEKSIEDDGKYIYLIGAKVGHNQTKFDQMIGEIDKIVPRSFGGGKARMKPKKTKKRKTKKRKYNRKK